MIEFDSFNWFNLHRSFIHVFGLRIKLYNLFNRVCLGGDHYWGIGLLQINSQHLIYVGYGKPVKVDLLFMTIYDGEER